MRECQYDGVRCGALMMKIVDVEHAACQQLRNARSVYARNGDGGREAVPREAGRQQTTKSWRLREVTGVLLQVASKPDAAISFFPFIVAFLPSSSSPLLPLDDSTFD